MKFAWIQMIRFAFEGFRGVWGKKLWNTPGYSAILSIYLFCLGAHLSCEHGWIPGNT